MLFRMLAGMGLNMNTAASGISLCALKNLQISWPCSMRTPSEGQGDQSGPERPFTVSGYATALAVTAGDASVAVGVSDPQAPNSATADGEQNSVRRPMLNVPIAQPSAEYNRASKP